MSAMAALLGRSARAPRRIERLGRDDVGADAENAPCERRGERAEIGVAAEHQVPAAYAALRRADAHLGAVRITQRLGVFEDARSGRPRLHVPSPGCS